MKKHPINVIFDTNVWISFLIGKRLTFLSGYLSSGQIKIIYCKQLVDEIKEVTSREKLKKYFPKESVKELVDLIETIGDFYEFNPINFISRDPKDNFLLDLIEVSKADYLISGDKDLLAHNPFKNTLIITPKIFELEITKQ
jgi:putative PIN family toxin of toxin-antitoxin system